MQIKGNRYRVIDCASVILCKSNELAAGVRFRTQDVGAPRHALVAVHGGACSKEVLA